ncbi:hypothetical protein HX109_15105 [Galbibacter sp. BG1]|uniref:hypothetical protein n=1 Tax=Galbibacter sp. BG1 TaxID=1170699 RepID=UPI0015BA5FE0|nr:hypothetical protein [Galbibacter sp. BG1]QLE02829.1 hypothetical protein HX109_15105 [Galbibacter sp. BG1]
MSSYFKEKELSAIDGKISSILKQSGFFKRNFWKVLGLGLLLSILGPFYKPEDDWGFLMPTVLEITDIDYFSLALSFLIFYCTACLIAHFVWKFQENCQLKALRSRKANLEKELNAKS